MDSTGLLISFGLWMDWVISAQMEIPPKPRLWAIPSSVVSEGADVTLRCQSLQRSDRFQLWKDGEITEQRSIPGQLAEFVFRSVDAWRDARRYICRSRQGTFWSEFSDPLLLVVTGYFSAPSISASPHYTVTPGITVTISCKRSPQMLSQDYHVALLEAKNLNILHIQSPGITRALFSLLPVKTEDSGSYRCIYYKKTAPHMGSYPSNILELTVSGFLPKPNLWTRFGLVMAPGTNITLLCTRPKLSALGEVTFTLSKAGIQEPLQNQTSGDLWTSFLLPSVGPEDTGSYSCAYRERTSCGGGSEPSDALELVMPGLKVNSKLIITLSCVSLLLFLLCLLLLALLCKRTIPLGSLQEDSRRRCLCCLCHPLSTCPSHHPMNTRDEVLSSSPGRKDTEVAKERSRQPLVPMNDEPQEVSYALLKINLSERKIDPPKTSMETVVYATVSKD